ncbi:MAG: hopanoid-associated sugar epimerase [Pseudomonadota bacterium]
MRALVTGGTGFVGAAVVRYLLAQGVEVYAWVRPQSGRRNLESLPIQLVEGDLTEVQRLTDAVRGMDAVFHVAADYRIWVPEPRPMYRANVDATVALVKAAHAAGVKRIVYTSSVAVLGIHSDGQPSDEQTPSRLRDMIGHYKRSKFLAEAAVRELTDAGAPVVIVNPSTPIGPRDVKPTPTGRMIVDAARGKMPAFVDTGLNVVHVDDVARGHWLAHEHGRIGQRYILGGYDLSLKDILHVVANHVGRSPPRVKLPHALVMPIAYGAEAWARLTRATKEPLATVDGVRMSKKKMFFRSDRAVRELGYEYRSAEDAIHDAIDWFAANDYLGP